MASVSHCKVVSSSSKTQSTSKCITCGSSISFTSSTSDSRPSTSTALTTSTHHRVVPLALSLATTQHQSTAQRTTVLPATVNVSMTRAGGGSHTAGVPALLRISSSGAVVGGTVLYPQPQAAFIKTEDASKSKKDMVAMANISSSNATSQVRRTLTQRTPRGPVNVNLALPANVLASINSDSSALRASHSAPNSPRSHQSQTVESGGPGKASGAGVGNQKTISLNLMNASQGSLLVPTSYANTGQVGQVVNAGRLITGNMLKLGNTLLHVALPQSTRQSSATSSGAPTTASDNTLLVSDGNLILTTMDENKQKRSRTVTEQLNLKSELRPMTLTTLNSSAKRASHATVTDVSANHSTTISHGSTQTTESREPTTMEPLSVTTNTVSVKSSKSSRPMEVT